MIMRFASVLSLLMAFLLVSAREERGNSKPNNEPLSARQRAMIKTMEHEAFSLGASGDPSKAHEKWKEIIHNDPRNGNAHMQLGMAMAFAGDPQIQLEGFEFLAKAFDSNHVDQVIPMPSPQGIALALLIGRYRWERKEYELTRKFIELAYKSGGDLHVSAAIQYATMLNPFPNSTQAASDAVALYIDSAERFLQGTPREVELDERALSNMVPGAANDPYVHCMLSIFYLSFYHGADVDVARIANLHYQIATRVWPALSYESKFIHDQRSSNTVVDKIKLGIASGALSPGSSVAADFSGVMQRLDRNKFEITYIVLNEGNGPLDPFVYKHKEDTVLDLRKQPEDVANGAWVTRYHPIIENLELDVLLYLDLTMSSHAHRTAMARLARVQAVSHGHPMTSGISTIDYFISWGAAEIETAQDHYTEELILLPKDSMHQYYDRRSNDTHSLINGRDYSAVMDRSTFSTIPSSGNWYTCMQKPHKFMPEMDELICNILQSDPDGRVILHELNTPILSESFLERLRIAGCDMSRVHFLPVQPHHQLLALYAVSTIILDSYPAGGCTTTREVLELGKAVVTLPSRLLGGRWTNAYYQILGAQSDTESFGQSPSIGYDELNDRWIADRLVALDLKDYVAKAVGLGRSNELRKDIELRIRMALPVMYQSKESVQSWENALLKIAPVQLAVDGTTCSS